MVNPNRGRGFRRFLILIVLGGIVFLGLAAFRAGLAPEITIEADLPGIGKKTTVEIAVEETRRGLADVRVEFVQGDRVEVLAERRHVPRPPWAFWGERTKREELAVEVGSETLRGLREGPAVVRVTAGRAGSWLRSPEPAVHELPLPVKLRPPAVQVTSSATYVAQGGCEAVVYRVGDSSVRDGVQAGTWWFPGFPLPGGDPQARFALFAAPYDLEDAGRIELVAIDDVGNRGTTKFVDIFTRKPFKTDTIDVSYSFITRVVPEILSHTPEIEDRGDVLASYLAINGDLRRANANTLIELGTKSVRDFLWTREFLQMPNAQVMSDFADRRTYVYDGRPVDSQDHLGFDLASTRMAPVPAANDGIVVLARYFGIYGNTVVLDHGYGLMSLYGHLSSIAVDEGRRVVRGEPVGRSGETGLAAGDHLHFTMLLHGLPVNPREWWDAHWIGDRLSLKLGGAMPFAG
jgi:murein DD-endopeptidase MepM/ murein hydrolase activator NlpD